MTRPTAVRLQDLVFRWQPRGPVVLALESLSAAPGERLFVEGPSGCGKTTLLSLLAGVAVPQQGEVEVLGRRLDRLPGAARDRLRADHIGVIFQHFNLVPFLSVMENVTLPCRFSRARRERAVADAGSLERAALRLLGHLDLTGGDLLRRPVTELSVGQQQRVAAARALIGAPGLLIADEPTSSLDSERRVAFIDLLERECGANGTTLLFVSHDPALARHFDRSLRLPALNRAGPADIA